MSSPIVRVLFQGRLLQTVPFDGDKLRIGRRKDNDIVINNLSVSRAHAELAREGDLVRLIDGGSENGCFVNGVRADQVDLGPEDELIIGKHQITVEYPEQPVEQATPPEAPGLDPQHATQLFPAGGETVATPEFPGGAEPVATPDDDFDDFPAVAGASATEPVATPEFPGGAEPVMSSPDTDAGNAADAFMQELTSSAPLEGMTSDTAMAADASAAIGGADVEVEFPESSDVAEHDVAFPPLTGLGDSDLGEMAEPAGDHADVVSDPAGGLESDIFDFTSLESSAPLEAPEPAMAPETQAAPPNFLHESAEPEAPANANDEATVTVLREGEAPRQLPWERPVMVIGRTSGCDIVLADPKISRRHAELERNASGFWVRDLESINFTFVNGEKITERQLHAGDVVSIEGFEMTVSAEALSDALPAEETDAAPELLVEVDTHPGLANPAEEHPQEVPVAEMLEDDHVHEGTNVDDEAADLLASLSPDSDLVDPPEPLEVLEELGEEETGFAMLAPAESDLSGLPEEEADVREEDAGLLEENAGLLEENAGLLEEEAGLLEEEAEVEPIALESPALDFSFEAELAGSEPSFEAEVAISEPGQGADDPPTLPPLSADGGSEDDLVDEHDAISDGLSESFEELRQHSPPPATAAPGEVFEEPGGELRDSSGIDSLFDGDDLDEKPEESHVGSLGGFSSQISFQADPGQTPMPKGKIRLELSLRMDALSPTLQRLLAEAEEEDLSIPLDVKVHIER